MATYVGDNNANSYFGGEDADDISGLGGADFLYGGGGRDRIRGGAAADRIEGGMDIAIDTLEGGAGDDRVLGRVKDRLFGDDGMDEFDLVFDNSTGLVVDLASLTLGGVFQFADGTRIDGFESGAIHFGSGADSVTASTHMAVNLEGGGGADTLTGRAQNDRLDGGKLATGDNDVLRGGVGLDVLIGGPGDTLDGGSETSYGDFMTLDLSASSFAYDVKLGGLAGGGLVDFGDGTRIVEIETGNLTFGSDGDRVRVGAIDGFIIQGGGGDDSLTGGAMADELEGGVGDDVIDGGGGVADSAYFWNADVGVTVSLAISGPQVTGVGLDHLIRIEHLVGSQQADQLTGSGGANHLGGLSGDDTLSGGGGGDTLMGGYSFGENDNDRLIGGAGGDTLTGGADSDVFVYLNIANSTVAAPDLITDLQAADVIDLSAIDADVTNAGNQAFVLVGVLGGNAGEATLIFDGTLTRLSLDDDGDGFAESVITMTGDQTGFTNFVP